MATRSLRILAFEPYDGGSHRAVREAISAHSRHAWTWMTRPPRAWKWRMRLAGLELADAFRAAGHDPREFDIVFATSLLALSDLRAALPRPLADRPAVLYMHENQVAYPAGHEGRGAGGRDGRDVHFALTNLAGILAADLVLWNSAWNRDSFHDGIRDVLRHAPDLAIEHLEQRLARSQIVWPPVEPPPPGVPRSEDGAVRVLWPHRWEHDKGPEGLLEVAERWTEHADLRWIVLGQRFREEPPAFTAFRARLADRIDHIGYVEDRSRYWQLVHRADWVLSTAHHEFFGIAVAEALLAGCLPWLPARLSYPELLPAGVAGLDPMTPPADPDALRERIRHHLADALAPRAVALIDDAIATVG